MNTLSRLRPLRIEEVRRLLTAATGPRVTVYLSLPESPGFDDLRHVRERRREAARTVERRLLRVGRPREEVTQRVDGLRSLLRDELTDEPLPGTRAVLDGPDATAAFDLPLRVVSLVAVARELVLVPLLRALHRDRPWRLLTLAKGRVGFYEGDLEGLREHRGERLPRDLADALGHRLVSPEDRQVHSAGGPIHHGHGGAAAERDLDTERFHRAVHRAAAELWGGGEDPLVVFADRSHQGRFRALGELPGLVPGGVEGSPDGLTASELHERVLPAVLEHRACVDKARLQRVVEGPPERWLHEDLEAMRRAADEGRVERLWLARRLAHDRRQDGVDRLAAQVLRQGGEVPVLDPDECGVEPGLTAELRW